MKKTKLLVPLLAVASLGTTIAPLVMLTSCGDKGKEDQGKVVDKARFNELKTEIYANLDSNHKIFDPSEVKITKTATGSPTEVITPCFISQNESDKHRIIKALYNQTNYETISCNSVFSNIEEILEKGGIELTFTEYNNSLEIQYTETEDQMEITNKFRVYKNGMFMYQKWIYKEQGTGTLIGEEGIEATYSASAHDVDKFVIDPACTNEQCAYLENSKDYTVTYKAINEIDTFRVGDSSTGMELGKIEAKVDGTAVEMKKIEPETGVFEYKLNTPIKADQTLEIKFQISGNKPVYKALMFWK